LTQAIAALAIACATIALMPLHSQANCSAVVGTRISAQGVSSVLLLHSHAIALETSDRGGIISFAIAFACYCIRRLIALAVNGIGYRLRGATLFLQLLHPAPRARAIAALPRASDNRWWGGGASQKAARRSSSSPCHAKPTHTARFGLQPRQNRQFEQWGYFCSQFHALSTAADLELKVNAQRTERGSGSFGSRRPDLAYSCRRRAVEHLEPIFSQRAFTRVSVRVAHFPVAGPDAIDCECN